MMLRGVRHVLGRHLARRRGGPGAQEHPDPVHLGGRPQKRQLSPSAVPALALPTRHEKDDRRPRRPDPHRCLSYAQAWHPLPRSRPEHFDGRAKTVQTGRLITHLHKLGYAVRITL